MFAPKELSLGKITQKMTLSQWHRKYIADLASLYPQCEAEGLFYRTVEYLWGLNRLHYSLQKDRILSPEESEKILWIFRELSDGRPLQYITGVQPFFGRDFLVDPRVLIPRGETEELVALLLSAHGKEPLRLLDIGTGSGAIAVTLAAERPGWQVTAVDISPDALEVAATNAKNLGVAVNFVQADILDESRWVEQGVYQVIVSNPPYVRESEKKAMHTNVLDHEPPGALFVPDADPLVFYRAIARFAKGALASGGRLYFEINEALGQETTALLEGLGFEEVKIHRDINGRDRMAEAQKND